MVGGRPHMGMDGREVRFFVEEVVRVSLALHDVLASLLESLPDDAFPGEDNADVLLGMLAGSVMPVAEAAGGQVLREATALVGAVYDKTVEDLRTAAELARRK